jgi:hypothetical protein
MDVQDRMESRESLDQVWVWVMMIVSGVELQGRPSYLYPSRLCGFFASLSLEAERMQGRAQDIQQ